MRGVSVLIAAHALSACGDGGQGSPAVLKISYNGSTPFPAVVGEAIALTPAVSGRADSYTVSPSLPSGLSLNARSGVISGTPTRPSAPGIFNVSATGAGVRVTFPLVLSVTEPPHGLSYVSPVNATVGAALAPLSPSIAGSVDHYTVSPLLPPGIVLNGSSGILSGTPTGARSVAPYTITANSLAGNTRFILLLTVKPAPSGAIPRHGPARRGLGRGRIQPHPSQHLPAGGTESSRNKHPVSSRFSGPTGDRNAFLAGGYRNAQCDFLSTLPIRF
jgi:hypothetical protein